MENDVQIDMQDPVVLAFQEATRLSLENDRSILEVIQALVKKVVELENKVDMLMGLHRVSDED